MVDELKKKVFIPEKKKQKKTGNKLISLRGVVIPGDWDKEGKIIATSISTHHEDEYLIMDDEHRDEMIKLISEEVEITGWSRKKGGKKMIRVKTCVRVSADSNPNKPSETTLKQE